MKNALVSVLFSKHFKAIYRIDLKIKRTNLLHII